MLISDGNADTITAVFTLTELSKMGCLVSGLQYLQTHKKSAQMVAVDLNFMRYIKKGRPEDMESRKVMKWKKIGGS